MDSDRLRYFSVVVETGSIRKAAEILRLSPAALSKAVKLLESESGLRLLTPSGRGILVTESGRELAARARPLLDGLSQLASTVREQELRDNETRPLRVGSFEVFTTHFLGALVEALPEETSLLLREVIPGELERRLNDREIDVGITYIPIPTAGVDHHEVASVDMAIYVRTGSFRGVPFERLPFVVPTQPLSGSPNKVQGLDGWPDGRIDRRIVYRVALMESALELCRRGKAAAYLPSFVAELHNATVRSELRLKPVNGPRGLGSGRQPVYLVRRRSDPEDPTFRKMARALRLACRPGGSGV